MSTMFVEGENNGIVYECSGSHFCKQNGHERHLFGALWLIHSEYERSEKCSRSSRTRMNIRHMCKFHVNMYEMIVTESCAY